VAGSDAIDLSNDLPEYVAECDEHLTAARRTLLALGPDLAQVDPGQVNALFRAFHSIKALSGMVGVGEAERLAHHIESFLGAIRRRQAALNPTGVEALFDGVQTIEGIVAARRDGQPAASVEGLIARFAALMPVQAESTSIPAPDAGLEVAEPEVEALAPDKRARLDAAVRQGARIWRVTFTPSAERAASGITINSVRARLQAAGEIIHAEPAALPGGRITFNFLIASPGDAFPAEIATDGLVVEPYHWPAVAVEQISAASPAGSPLTPTNLVRVDLGRLDDLMRMVGELVITRARLENGLGRVGGGLPVGERRELAETSLALERQLRDLRDGVMRVRLVPVRDVFDRMRLAVRDLARETGKDVDLHLTGEQTEVDKFVVERLADPLLHLVRNAVSHGLEPAAERTAVGKPARGRLDLRAAAVAGGIRIEVEDDGRGIDSERVFARARAAGLVPPDAPVNPTEVLDLICTPGFSTRETVDRASGRGVGMDVVRRAVDELGGTLTLDTRSAKGTKFTARLPLTLAIADALILTANGQTYALPQAAVREVIQVEPASTIAVESAELVRHHARVIPLVRLSDVFGGGRRIGSFPALVAGEESNPIALAADQVLGLREVVVRPLSDPLVQVPGLVGVTELGDGRAVLILDPVGLARSVRARRRATA
jgi:two-component system, chemotaxis family, sensor kinase CheA